MSDGGVTARLRRAASHTFERAGRVLTTAGERVAGAAQRTLERMPRPIRSAVDVGGRVLDDAGRDRVQRLAAEVAFFALLALPPALLAVLGSVGYVFELLGQDTTERVREQVMAVAQTFLTTSTVEEVVAPTVRTVLEEGQAGVIGGGVLVALWSTSRATAVVVEVVRIAGEVEQRRPDFVRRVIALGYTVALVLALVVLIPLMFIGPRIAELIGSPFGLEEAAVRVWEILYWPAIAAVAVVILATSYWVVLGRRRPWRRQLPGALLAVVTWLLGSVALRIYASWSVESQTIFGPLSAPLILLLWLYVAGIAVLFGAELNGVLHRRSQGRRARREAR
jgi:membrane protein